MVTGLAWYVAWFAAATTLFSQPSMQPAPAIQRATVKASTTRSIRMEEKSLILLQSVASKYAFVEAGSA